MGFAVHRPGIPEASPRSHGVPRRDVLGRVHISVAGENTGRAAEDGLALARLPIHVPARRAPLARERGVDLLYAAGSFLLQPTYQQGPPRPQDDPVEPGLLADVPARVFPSAFRRSGHVLDLEFFDPDQVEPVRDLCAGLLHPVLAPIGLTGAQPGDGQLYARAMIRAASGAGQLPFHAQQALAFLRCQAGGVQQISGRQSQGHRHTPVDADDLTVIGRLNRIRDSRKGNMPTSRSIACHSVGLNARRHCPGPAESYPPGLRHPDFADVAGRAAHIPLPPTSANDLETLVSPCLSPRRPSGRVVRVEEGCHRAGEVAKCLLLHHLRAFCQPWVLRSRLCKLPALFQVARSALPARTPMRVLLDRQVPYVPGVAAVAPQHCLLSRRGDQPVMGHTNILSTATVISGEVKRRFLHGPEAEVRTPRF